MPATERYEPKAVLPRHRTIMRLQLANFKKCEIAEILGMSAAAVSYITNSGLYKAEFDKLQAKADEKAITEHLDVRQKIGELSKTAILELEDALKDKTAPRKLRVDVAFDILDRDGYKAPEERHVTVDYIRAARKAFAKRKANKLLRDGTTGKVIPFIPKAEE